MNSPPFNLGEAGLDLSLRLYFQAGTAAPALQSLGDAEIVGIGPGAEYYLAGLPDPGPGSIGIAVAYLTAEPDSALYTYIYRGVGALAGTVPVTATIREPWIVGEYGGVLRIAMPFDPTGGTVVVKVRRPTESTWRTWTADTVTEDEIEHTILSGELNKVGLYRGVVEVTATGQLRKALFTFAVGSATGAEIEGTTT